MGALETFDSSEWELVSIEVRADTGKFVTTAWERYLEGARWRVVIGYRDVVETMLPVDPDRPLKANPTSCEFLSFVEQVNRALLEEQD